MKRPSFQFYPGDWLNDAGLRMCSAGARGLWMDMICLMHQGTPYGFLKVNLLPILPMNLARISGATLPEVEGWLIELESAGVFSRDECGAIFSRRMIRDEEIRASRAAGGSLGGNPKLKQAKEGSAEVPGKVNLPANLQPTPSSSSSSSSSKDQKLDSSPDKPETPIAEPLFDSPNDSTKSPRQADITRHAIEAYNSILAHPVGVLAKVSPVGFDKRQIEVRRCIKLAGDICRETYGSPVITPEFWQGYFAAVDRDDFLSGRQRGGNGHENWKPDFEFLTRVKTMLKVYDRAASEAEAA